MIAIEPEVAVQIDLDLPGWQKCDAITDLPKPTATQDYRGWKVGIVCHDSKLHHSYIHHPELGAWAYELPEAIEVKGKKRWSIAINAIDSLGDIPTISELPENNIVAIAISDRPVKRSLIERSRIRRDGDTQRRVAMSSVTIANYTELISIGVKLPPLKLMQANDGDLWLYDGFHTDSAYGIAGIESVDCEIIQGTLEEAQDLALSVNGKHGLPRSNEDKASAVKWALSQPRHADKSNQAIADLCRVSAPFVATVKESIKFKGSDTRVVQRGNQVYRQKVEVRTSLEEVQTLYADWGTIERSVVGTASIELRQRDRLIVQFGSTNEAVEKHPEITGQISKLVDLPLGPHRCLFCAKRTVTSGDEWECDAKRTNYAIDFDWAESNNGDCRLHVLLEQPAIVFNTEDYVAAPPVVATPPPIEETINPEDYVTPSSILKSGAKSDSDPDKPKDEQYTPEDLTNAMLRVFGANEFDLDPTSHPASKIPCRRIYTKEDDALAQDWTCENLWFNFPFSLHLPLVEKFLAERSAGKIPMAGGLLKCDCRPRWFQKIVAEADAICMVSGAWEFGRPDSAQANGNSSFFGIVIVYFGPDAMAFYREFSPLGIVSVPVVKM